MPSEPALLEWGDIDWHRRSIRVHSPKTEHHEGRGERVLPLFQRLEPYLRDTFELAEEGQPLVFPMLQKQAPQALRKPLINALRRAG